jgi:hypothetical protein
MAPSRRDIELVNDATVWLLTSAGLNGRPPGGMEPGQKRWKEAVADGTLLPMSLYQDEPLLVRVVVGAPLAPQEEAEWVARLTWKLAIPDGKLVLCGGPGYPEDGEQDDFVRVLDVPPGTWRVDVYTHMPSPNGGPALAKAGVKGRGLLRYWKETRGEDAPAPAWLYAQADVTSPEEKAREAEAERRKAEENKSWRTWAPDPQALEDEGPPLVGVLVHLTPLKGAEALEPPRLKEGWASFGEVRKPARCPEGIVATAVEGLDEEATSAEGLAVQVDVAARVRGYALAPLEGGPLLLPVADAAQLYLAANLCHDLVVAQLRVDLRGRPFAADWPPVSSGILVTPTPEGFVVDLEAARLPKANVRRVYWLGPLLARLPDGARLELSTAENMDPTAARSMKSGVHRFRGEVRGGTWHVGEAFPAVGAAALRELLALAQDVERVGPLSFRSERERRSVLKNLERDNPFFDASTLRHEGLTVFPADASTAKNVGEYLARARFGDTLDFLDLSLDA